MSTVLIKIIVCAINVTDYSDQYKDIYWAFRAEKNLNWARQQLSHLRLVQRHLLLVFVTDFVQEKLA